MAAATVMVTSPSSLIGGNTTVNEIDRAVALKSEPSAPEPEPKIQAEDLVDNNRNEKQARSGSESSQSSTEKPMEFNDTTKKPPRMSSVDDYTMLQEGYAPKDEDVICSWARQNHSHRKLKEKHPFKEYTIDLSFTPLCLTSITYFLRSTNNAYV